MPGGLPGGGGMGGFGIDRYIRKGEGLRRDRNYILKKLCVNRSKKKPPNKVRTTKQIQNGGCSQMTCDVLHATNKENLSLTAFQPIEFSYRNS